jgi:hypothetical protein
MERMVGSRSAHEAMNSRIETMIGAVNADRMHQALGRRYAGCATTATGSGMMGGAGMTGGAGMMGGASTGGGWGAMMGSDLSWMRQRQLAAHDPRRLAERSQPHDGQRHDEHRR